MSLPEHQHPIDPLSERLGALGADVAGIKDRLGRIELTMATKAELRVWGTLLGGLMVTGLSVLGWVVTRR